MSMILKLSKNELEKCRQFLQVKEANLSAAELYIEYLNFHSQDITKFDIKKLSEKYEENEAYFRAFLHSLKIANNNEEFHSINQVCNIRDIKKLNISDYTSDIFYQKFHPISVQQNDWIFTQLNYAPFEGFVYDELDVNEETYAEHTPLGYFEQEFPYFAVIQKEDVWMSVIPHEINTMKEAIQEATGDVVVLGLGLGYYLYHIHLKEDVKHIRVIENDPNVVEMFKKHLLPHYEHPDKIEIILDDALAYIGKDSTPDFVFCDLWHNVGDGEKLYLLLKAKEKQFPEPKYMYWIERSILCMLRRQMLTIFEEQLEGYTEKDYLKAKNDNDLIINRLYFLTKDIVIDSKEKLHDLLSEASLKELAKNIY